VPNKRAPGVTVHNIAVDTGLWRTAMTKARSEGSSLTAVIVRLLRAYVNDQPHERIPE
jgi:hypothetical protein